jgi:hypothetical protein
MLSPRRDVHSRLPHAVAICHQFGPASQLRRSNSTNKLLTVFDGLLICNNVRAGERAAVITDELTNSPLNNLTVTQAATIIVAATQQVRLQTDSGVRAEAMRLSGRNPDVPERPAAPA